eukprot:1158054-Pleurochrysis_carterae.AAC.1
MPLGVGNGCLFRVDASQPMIWTGPACVSHPTTHVCRIARRGTIRVRRWASRCSSAPSMSTCSRRSTRLRTFCS